MMRLDDAAYLAKWSALERRAAIAPHGHKRKRERELREFAHRLLKQETRKGRRKAG
jgi:hypothetical protein